MIFIIDDARIKTYQTDLKKDLLVYFNQNLPIGNDLYHYNNLSDIWYCNPKHGKGVPHFLNLFGINDNLTGIEKRMLVGINFEMDPPYASPRTPAGFFNRESDGHILIGHKGILKCKIGGKQGNLDREYFFLKYGLANTFFYGKTQYAIVADLSIGNNAQQVIDFVSKVIGIKNSFGCE